MPTFTYRAARTPVLTAAAAGVVLVESLVLHVALHGRHPMLAWASTALGMSTLAWVAADARAFARGALRLDADALHLAIGRRWAGDIPRAAVERVLRPTWRDLPAPGARDGARYVNLTRPARPNVLVVLRTPVRLRFMGLRGPPVLRVALHVDAPEALTAALEA